jgi:hypothetical protein
MGASSSREEKARSLAVSRYHEFITEGLTDADKARMATIITDSQGIIRMRGKYNTDFMMTEVDRYGPTEEYRKEIRDIQNAFVDAHRDTYDEWADEYYLHNVVETVDLADISDWFQLFVLQLNIKRIHIVVERQFDNIKLTRLLMFLFYHCRHRLETLALSCNVALSDLVKPCIWDAYSKMNQLKDTRFASIVNGNTRTNESGIVGAYGPTQRWNMKETEKDAVVTYAFTIAEHGAWRF